MHLPEHIKKIVVDGANVAYATKACNKAEFKNLTLLMGCLESIKIDNPAVEIEIICDASLRYSIDNPANYDLGIEAGILKQCPPHIKADVVIINYLQQFDGEIVLISNDLMRDHPEIQTLNHRIQYGFAVAFNSMQLVQLNIPATSGKKHRHRSKKASAVPASANAEIF